MFLIFPTGENIDSGSPSEIIQIEDNRGPNNEQTITEKAIYVAMRNMIDSVLALLTAEQISKTIAKNIFNQMNMVFSLTNELLNSYLKSNLPLYKNSNVEELNNLFFQNISNILSMYCSEYYIIKNLKQKPNFVEPISKVIGSRIDMTYDRKIGRYIENTKICEFYYVPLKATLECLFKNQNFVSNFFDTNHICKDGIYQKFCCGNMYKASQFHQRNPNAIRLQLYYDDFRLTNNKSNVSVKMGGVYFTIENVPRILNSHIDNIHLLALFHTIDLKNYGQSFNTILYPIVEEIKDLENSGITTANGQILGTLVSYAADNLALHTSYGMFESFSARFFCQHCKITKEASTSTVSENEQTLRTFEDIRYLFGSNLSQSFDRVSDGIGMKRYSYLNDIQHYDIFANLTIDVLHDLLEGSIPLTLRKFLQKAIDLKKIELDKINEKILLFDYGISNSKNKPTEISLDEHMGNSASQKLVLFLHFPFIFHELISDDEMRPYWETLSYLLGITKICLSADITENDLSLLESYIENYLKTYISNYKGTLVPKQHYLTHYPRVIRNMGPPVTMWTMR